MIQLCRTAKPMFDHISWPIGKHLPRGLSFSNPLLTPLV